MPFGQKGVARREHVVVPLQLQQCQGPESKGLEVVGDDPQRRVVRGQGFLGLSRGEQEPAALGVVVGLLGAVVGLQADGLLQVADRQVALGRRQVPGLAAFLFMGTGHEQGAGAEQLGAVGLPFDGAVERQGGLVEPALPLTDLDQKGMGMVGLGVEQNGRLEVGKRLVEPAGLKIHPAPIDQQDVAEVRAGPQLECAAVVVLGGREGFGRLELPLGRARRVSL